MTSKFYSVIFLVIEASTDVMKDYGILSAPFSVSELKHKHGERCIWYLYLAINGTRVCWHDDLIGFVLPNSYLGKVNCSKKVIFIKKCNPINIRRP